MCTKDTKKKVEKEEEEIPRVCVISYQKSCEQKKIHTHTHTVKIS